MRGGKWKAILLCLILVVIASVLLLFHDLILLQIGNYLVIEDDLSPAGVVHVIAGEDYRTDHAIQLYKQGHAKQIFFTGGWCNTHQYHHGQHGRDRALSFGVPPEDIVYDDTPVKSTYDEAVLLKAYIDARQPAVKSVIIVSDPYHMRRARWTYRQVLGKEITVTMSPVPFENTPYKTEWWSDWASRNYVKEEYLKGFYYILRYQVSWGPVKEWLASFDRQ